MRAFLLLASTAALLLLALLSATAISAASLPAFLRLPHDNTDDADAAADASNNIHALLVVGSSGYGNYRHQADVMHVSEGSVDAACRIGFSRGGKAFAFGWRFGLPFCFN